MLSALGHEAHEIVANVGHSRGPGLEEHGARTPTIPFRSNARKSFWSKRVDYEPDVVYVQNMQLPRDRLLAEAPPVVGTLIVGQIASEPPSGGAVQRI